MINVRVGQKVKIINETAQILPHVYNVDKVTDKIVTVSGPNGRFRIHQSRVESTLPLYERRNAVANAPKTKPVKAAEGEAKATPQEKATATAPPAPTKAAPKDVKKFDVSPMKQSGSLLHKGPEPFPPQNPTMKRDSYVWISEDGAHEKVFNLYGGGLGKKGKDPKAKPIDKERFPDAESRRQKWIKQGYKLQK